MKKKTKNYLTETMTQYWLCFSLLEHLSGQILLHIVPGNKNPSLESPTFQLQILPLSP